MLVIVVRAAKVLQAGQEVIQRDRPEAHHWLILISIPPPHAIANAVCPCDARRCDGVRRVRRGRRTAPAWRQAARRPSPEERDVHAGGRYTPPNSPWKYGMTRCDTRIGKRGPNRKFVRSCPCGIRRYCRCERRRCPSQAPICLPKLTTSWPAPPFALNAGTLLAELARK